MIIEKNVASTDLKRWVFVRLAKKIFRLVSGRSRKKRGKIFIDNFVIGSDTRILDLGSEDGSNLNAILHGSSFKPENIFIADINSLSVHEGSIKYGFVPVVIDESDILPFPDKFFDIVFCSSVIEHVTLPKDQIWKMFSGKRFNIESRKRQNLFAMEIKRLGKQYFVQTPNKNFPIESHSWLPFFSFLPRFMIIQTLKVTNLFWIKKTNPDWCLLTRYDLSYLFGEAEVYEEKLFGLTKSLMAIYSEK